MARKATNKTATTAKQPAVQDTQAVQTVEKTSAEPVSVLTEAKTEKEEVKPAEKKPAARKTAARKTTTRKTAGRKPAARKTVKKETIEVTPSIFFSLADRSIQRRQLWKRLLPRGRQRERSRPR